MLSSVAKEKYDSIIKQYKNRKLNRGESIRTSIKEFTLSGQMIMEVKVDLNRYKSISTAIGTLAGGIRSMGLLEIVDVTRQKNHVYLVNKKLLAEAEGNENEN